LPQFTIWPFDHQAAEEYGRIAAELRRSGRPMQVVDMMGAAVALSLEQ
jgi:tRNA(fMet)-specific endonuclease VapC